MAPKPLQRSASRKMPARRRHTAEERERALALYVSAGPKEAARRSKIPESTISSWARREGLRTKAVSRNRAGTVAARAKAARVRAELQGELLAKALEVLRRMDKEHIDFRGKDALKVTFPRPTATGVREYAVAVGILIDKYRLEMGEETDRRALVHSGDLTLREVPDDELKAALARILTVIESG